ncbi:hypothetical protein YC2023_055464 [Brassica napus]
MKTNQEKYQSTHHSLKDVFNLLYKKKTIYLCRSFRGELEEGYSPFIQSLLIPPRLLSIFLLFLSKISLFLVEYLQQCKSTKFTLEPSKP